MEVTKGGVLATFGFLHRFSDCGANSIEGSIPLSIEPVFFCVDSKIVISAKICFPTFFSSGPLVRPGAARDLPVPYIYLQGMALEGVYLSRRLKPDVTVGDGHDVPLVLAGRRANQG